MEREELKGTVLADCAVDAGRRSAMRKIAVSVGVLATYSVLPESWTRPIIGQIVVPVHAATSGSSLHDPCSVDQRSGDQKSETVMIKVTGYVTPPVGNLPVMIVATATGGANQRVEGQTTTYPDGTFEAYLTVGGGPGITAIGVTTTVTGADGAANCSVNITTASTSSGTSRSFSQTITISEHTAPFCVTITGSTATFYAFEDSSRTRYITGTGLVTASSISGNIGQSGMTEDTTITVSGIANLTSSGGSLTITATYPEGSDSGTFSFEPSSSCI